MTLVESDLFKEIDPLDLEDIDNEGKDGHPRLLDYKYKGEPRKRLTDLMYVGIDRSRAKMVVIYGNFGEMNEGGEIIDLKRVESIEIRDRLSPPKPVLVLIRR